MGDCFAPLGPPLLPWDSMAQTDRQTHRTTDMATSRPTRPSGAELVKIQEAWFDLVHSPSDENPLKQVLQHKA